MMPTFSLRIGEACCLANSPAAARRTNSFSASAVTYCRPQMFTVSSHPLRRIRHTVTAEMSVSRQNFWRDLMGGPSLVAPFLSRACEFMRHEGCAESATCILRLRPRFWSPSRRVSALPLDWQSDPRGLSPNPCLESLPVSDVHALILKRLHDIFHRHRLFPARFARGAR